MKIKLEAANGNSRRMKLYDAETGIKLGRVQSINLEATLGGETLQFIQILPITDELYVSPKLVGVWSDDHREFWFEEE